ncbi:l-ascorbate oxidase-like protein [Hordeum vulgare]|nr:l-ascorbate oxidase-like protein [Hordeum vulgare]
MNIVVMAAGVGSSSHIWEASRGHARAAPSAHCDRGGAPPPRSHEGIHAGEEVHGFLMVTQLGHRSWLRLRDLFARAMEGRQPRGLWLRADSSCNGPVWAAVDLTPGSAMFLMQGWKSFARSRGIGPEHLLHFRFDSSTILFVNFFGESGVRLDYHAESSSGSEFDTSSDNGDDSSIFVVKQEGDDSK